MQLCPCGTNQSYSDCCGAFISGSKSAPTPEALMRSRYTAYSHLNMGYIANTMKSPAADGFDLDATKQWAEKIKWTQLKIINTETILPKGTVEFMAHYEIDHQKSILYEVSEFRFEEGRWYYINGFQPKIGRNDMCPCGSGKKY